MFETPAQSRSFRHADVGSLKSGPTLTVLNPFGVKMLGSLGPGRTVALGMHGSGPAGQPRVLRRRSTGKAVPKASTMTLEPVKHHVQVNIFLQKQHLSISNGALYLYQE